MSLRAREPRLLRVLFWLRILPAAAALLATPWLPDASRRERVELVLSIVFVWMPWSTARLRIAARSNTRLATALAVAVDVLLVFALQVFVPSVTPLALLGQMLLVALYTFLGGWRAGAGLSGAVVILTVAARALAPGAHRVDAFTLAIYTATLAALVALLTVAKEAADAAARAQSTREIAETLQRSLLVPTLPAVPGIELATAYQPGGEGIEVGGDFYDCFPLGDDWMLAIGDVSGRGAPAAALTALVRYTLRVAMMQGARPAGALALLNDALLRDGSQRSCTVALTRFSPPDATGLRLCLACGGHPLPLLVSPDGHVRPVGQFGLLLGVLPRSDTKEMTVLLAPGDALVLYTDGVTEAHGADGLFGEARLVDVLAGAAGLDVASMATRVGDAVSAYRVGPARDDLAVVVLRVAEDGRQP
jgi:hypothetical protein